MRSAVRDAAPRCPSLGRGRSPRSCGLHPDPAPVPSSPRPIASSGEWWTPGPGVTWQIQLLGDLDIGRDVAVYDVDLLDTAQPTIDRLHADGRRVVCYFSAGSHEDWRTDAADYPAVVLGLPLEGWPGGGG